MKMAETRVLYIFLLIAFLCCNAQLASGVLTSKLKREISKANKEGPYLGLVIPNAFELNPLLQSPNYTSSDKILDFAGRRFRFGTIGDKPVILIMTGLGMINAAITTQLLLSFFKVEGVVHYGTSGNGPQDELPLEAKGDYTRDIGYLKFADYTSNVSEGSSYDNLLNNIWYQPEEVFPIDGTPEERQHIFWVPVDSQYFRISQKLKALKLQKCMNTTTCLPTMPKVVQEERGASASIFLSNDGYKTFLHKKFNVSTIDMESASVALICLQQRVPFIAIRSISGGSKFMSLASVNSAMAVIEFIKQLSLSDTSSM